MKSVTTCFSGRFFTLKPLKGGMENCIKDAKVFLICALACSLDVEEIITRRLAENPAFEDFSSSRLMTSCCIGVSCIGVYSPDRSRRLPHSCPCVFFLF